ncbi:MAG: c-type cytochrome, partial [Pirellulales bacterium]|nr:c-type cytochrome [Pirellulales bacterium]
GRLRDLAQAWLIRHQDKSIAGRPEEMVRHSDRPMARLHALCTLDGRAELPIATLRRALADQHATVRRHAIRVSESWLRQNHTQVLSWLEERVADDPHVRLQLAYSLGASTSPEAVELLARLAAAADDEYQTAAVLSSLGEHNLADFYHAIHGDLTTLGRFRASLLEMAIRMENAQVLHPLVSGLLESAESQQAAPSTLRSLTQAVKLVRRRKIRLTDELETSIAALAERLQQTARDDQASTGQRVAAIEFLTAVKHDVGQQVDLVSANEPVAVQLAAAESLIDDHIGELLTRLPTLSPKVRAGIVDLLLARRSSTLALVETLQKNKVPLQLIESGHRLAMQGHADDKIRQAASQWWMEGGNAADKKRLLQSYREVSPREGSAELGRKIFVKHCAACHRVQGLGHEVGPDLAGLRNRAPHALLTAILDPNAAVESKYQNYSLLTVDGMVASGIIVNESSTAIKLR